MQFNAPVLHDLGYQINDGKQQKVTESDGK